MQLLARANLIFGLHVHVGIKDRDARVPDHERGALLPAAPARPLDELAVLAGPQHGPEELPHEGLRPLSRAPACPSTSRRPAEFDEFVRILVKTNCIDNGKKIWWDVRPHPFFETIEFRVCDVPMRLDETVTLAALFQAICVKLYKLRQQNLGLRRYRRALILENKWRASRYGIDGKLIDFGKEIEVAVPRASSPSCSSSWTTSSTNWVPAGRSRR